MNHNVRVLFDGDCPFCQACVRWLKRLDWLGRLAYVNVRQGDDPRLADVKVSKEALLEQMHVVMADGETLRGFAGVRRLAWRLPLLWPLVPLLYLPGAGRVGQRLYAWIARNRFQLLPCRDGVCAVR